MEKTKNERRNRLPCIHITHTNNFPLRSKLHFCERSLSLLVKKNNKILRWTVTEQIGIPLEFIHVCTAF